MYFFIDCFCEICSNYGNSISLHFRQCKSSWVILTFSTLDNGNSTRISHIFCRQNGDITQPLSLMYEILNFPAKKLPWWKIKNKEDEPKKSWSEELVLLLFDGSGRKSWRCADKTPPDLVPIISVPTVRIGDVLSHTRNLDSGGFVERKKILAFRKKFALFYTIFSPAFGYFDVLFLWPKNAFILPRKKMPIKQSSRWEQNIKSPSGNTFDLTEENNQHHQYTV